MSPRRPIVDRIVEWLERGYPEGVPPQDRFAVGALLRNRLSDNDIAAIVKRMATSHHVKEWVNNAPPTEEDIARYIRKVADGLPTMDDIQRVSSRLASAGGPLAALFEEMVNDDDKHDTDDTES